MKRNAVIIAVVAVVAVLSLLGITYLDGFDFKKTEVDATSSSLSFSDEYQSDSFFSLSQESTESVESSDFASSTVFTFESTEQSTDSTVSTITSSESSIITATPSQSNTISSTTEQSTSTSSSETKPVTPKNDNITFGRKTNTSNKKYPTVYFTRDISAAGMLKIYKRLGKNFGEKVACKLSTGESSASYYLRPNLIKDTVQYVNGTIVECNTAYGGVRSSTILHKQLAADHGFTSIADVDILDEKGSLKIPVSGGKYLDYNLVGSHFSNYDSYLVLSHFKGHPMGGFGGSLKNISIGLASRQGKCRIHTAGKSNTVMLGLDQDAFLECMADAAKSVCDYLGSDNITFINVMNNLSVDCDCVALPAAPKMADVGILASDDPVALDQACVDIIYLQKDGDGKSLVNRIESLNGIHTLERAEENGLGSRNYNLVPID